MRGIYRRLTAAFLLLMLLLLAGSQNFFIAEAVAAGTIYYISPVGSDNNPGTAAQPFKTIQQGIARALPGDTIIVKPGTYGGAEWDPNRSDGQGGTSGTATARIILKAENPAMEVAAGQRAILSGNGSGYGLLIKGISYVTIDGFEITNFGGGVAVVGNNNLIFRRNILRSNTGEGIECVPCSDSLFEYNSFLDPGPPYPDLGNAVQDYGLNFYEGSANNSVVYNYFFGKHNQALSWKRKAGPGYAAYNTFEGFMYTAVYLGQNDDEAGQDMTSFDITIECNVFRDAVDSTSGAYYRSRSPIAVRNVQNAVIRANFIENMFGSAIEVIPCESSQACLTVAGKKPVGAEIYGNTIINGKTVDPHSGELGNPPAIEITGRGFNNDVINIYNNTIYNTNSAFLISNTPGRVNPRETSNPPTLIIKNNNLVNVKGGVSGNTSTTTFAYNNWYELNNPAVDNRQDATDTKLEPHLVGPLTVFDPFTFKGPNPVYTPDFSRNQAYHLSGDSLLIDAGIDVGLPFDGSAPDIGSNESIAMIAPPATPTPIPPTPTSPTATPTCVFHQIYLPLIRHG